MASEAETDDGNLGSASPVAAEAAYGCVHYLRRCAFVSPCCGKIYTCRLCHDDNETHEIDRHAVMSIVCQGCKTTQSIVNNCTSCGVQFGRYFCSVCRMYDDRDKQQFHCGPCGICRVGGRDNFFHCPKCDMCLSINLQDSHKCVEKCSKNNCPVCFESLHSSLITLHVPKCGHIMHFKCWTEMMENGIYRCAVCCQSMADLSDHWALIDEEIATTPMPEEYKDVYVWIHCQDCQKKTRALFHVIGLKCGDCGSYNTCRDAEPTNHNDLPAAEK